MNHKEIALKTSQEMTREERLHLIYLDEDKKEEVEQVRLENGWKNYIMKEGSETFTVLAKDKEDAEFAASMYNAVIIGIEK